MFTAASEPEPPPPPLPDRIIRWQAHGWTGLEHLHFKVEPDRISIESMVMGDREDMNFALSYRLSLDRRWTVREAHLRVVGQPQGLHLYADGRGYWHDGMGAAYPGLDGCFDIDIAVTPFTSGLPMRRLGLKPNEAKDIRVVFISIPDLTPMTIEQRFRCLEPDRRYRFQALGGDGSYEVELDEDGIVRDYPGAFTRLT